MVENLAYNAESGCWAYDNDQRNIEIYGYLYDWNTAVVSCPEGWHLPTDQEWENLTIFISKNYDGCEKGVIIGLTLEI